jgi:uncharacterized FAD-dependent dehydrogenase
MKASKKHYSIAIIGGGIGGIMAAYRLSEEVSDILLIEKGSELKNRKCPVIERQAGQCKKCPSCAVMEGMAGAGAFSDGKYVISTEYGGWLTDFIDDETVMDYIEQADDILVAHGASAERFIPDAELKTVCLRHDLHMQQAQLKHIGTDAIYHTMERLIDKLAQRVEILALTEVADVDKDTHTLVLNDKENTDTVIADRIIFAVGRSGSRFFSRWCNKNGIPLENNQVDIGVRVELPWEIWKHFSQKVYEPKIWYRSKAYGDITRMFCFNERGSVVTENTDGVLTVNGHSFKDENKKTANSNFALLSTIRFTQPFNEPIEYARFIASLANKISGGSVLVQRLGDMQAGRRSNEHRIKSSATRPTLNAVPGDLGLCMPKRQLDNIIETLHALDKIAPGTANHDTLLYGVECKYYSARPKCDDFEIEGCRGIYAVAVACRGKRAVYSG